MMFASRATTILRRVNLSFFFQTMKTYVPRKIDLQIKVMAGFLFFFYSTIGTCLAGHHIADLIQVDIVQY